MTLKMKPKISLVLFIMMLSGCASSLEDNWYRAAASVRAAQEAVIAAHETGTLSDEKLIEIDPFLRLAEKALLESEKLLDKDPGESRLRITSVMDLLARISRLYFAETGGTINDGS